MDMMKTLQDFELVHEAFQSCLGEISSPKSLSRKFSATQKTQDPIYPAKTAFTKIPFSFERERVVSGKMSMSFGVIFQTKSFTKDEGLSF